MAADIDGCVIDLLLEEIMFVNYMKCICRGGVDV